MRRTKRESERIIGASICERVSFPSLSFLPIATTILPLKRGNVMHERCKIVTHHRHHHYSIMFNWFGYVLCVEWRLIVSEACCHPPREKRRVLFNLVPSILCPSNIFIVPFFAPFKSHIHTHINSPLAIFSLLPRLCV